MRTLAQFIGVLLLVGFVGAYFWPIVLTLATAYLSYRVRGVEAASSMVLGRHLRCDVGPGRGGVRVRCRDGRGPGEAAVGGFDERAGASTLRGRTLRHARHRGLYRLTRKRPMSPTITRSAAHAAGSPPRFTP